VIYSQKQTSAGIVPLRIDLTFAERENLECLASITFPGPRQLHFPINDNYSNGFGLAGKGEARARSVRFCLRERDSGGGKSGKPAFGFHFSIRSRRRSCGNVGISPGVGEISKGLWKGWEACFWLSMLSTAPAFPQLSGSRCGASRNFAHHPCPRFSVCWFFLASSTR